MYADTDFWVALLKDDDWLADRAEAVLEDFRGDLEVSLAIFIELFLIEERFDFDRGTVVTSILELANYDGEEDVVYQASEYIDDGLNTFDAVHAALAGDAIISSDKAFDGIDIDRIRLEADPEG